MAIGAVHEVGIPESIVAPRYSFAEADRLARVRTGTSKRWTRGYAYDSPAGERVSKPPVGKAQSPSDAAASFADLIEVAAIHGLRELGFSLPQIRDIVDGCQQIFESERPLLSHRFRVDGRDAFVQGDDGVLVSVLRGKRRTAWDDVLDRFLASVDYRDGWVHRWWPGGRTRQVVIDPDFGFGLPVVAGTGVRTEILLERSAAGESVDEIAGDFAVSAEAVRDALKFEHSLVA